ncbi:glycine betaine ABC transporter substrate-binding protein [Streptomyces sp. NBC_01803]|uniref:glycine betaine ABC transporter substrate-binding protein n=1 Tax=Streptomyces sp. NBC_01803 TaxID=2975946 RepID=UPI002DD9BA5D|nr:glycine betaine ABC transporter substrate-binding protein [Streptomyces sp. NBC_01803]WSA43074.1 glycine betaine ABC transporter substrate-binding protein [Streptomyces sp. NBC_01803]
MRSFSRRPLLVGPPALAVALATLAGLTAGCALDTSDGDAEPGSLAETASLDGASFTVGSKEFTEQLVLCQITGLALRSAGADVSEECGLQGSNTTRGALESGDIDMYWEYTGTAWINFLGHTEPIDDAAEQYASAASEDLEQNEIAWLTPAPANNTYAIVVKTSTAEELGVASLSDYAELVADDPGQASLCIASEFAGRDDGLPGLEEAYGFHVPDGDLATLAEGAIYNAVADNDPCNFGEAATTDGRIEALDLTVLTDDRSFFPVYNPALTVRASVLEEYPDLEGIFEAIAPALTDEVLQGLNARVDIDGEEPTDVARDWLQQEGFIG